MSCNPLKSICASAAPYFDEVGMLGKKAVQVVKDHPFYFLYYFIILVTLIAVCAAPATASGIKIGISAVLIVGHLVAAAVVQEHGLLADTSAPGPGSVVPPIGGHAALADPAAQQLILDQIRTNQAKIPVTRTERPSLQTGALLRALGYLGDVPTVVGHYHELAGDAQKMPAAVVCVKNEGIEYLFFKLRNSATGQTFVAVLKPADDEWFFKDGLLEPISPDKAIKHPLYTYIQGGSTSPYHLDYVF